MSMVRFRFSRKGPIRYIGHLDMLRYFQKAVLRSGIDARYSEGFHPHQLMSFAYPLAVGMETAGDYMELKLSKEGEPDTLIKSLNAVMHEGVAVDKATILPDGAESGMALVSAADYCLRVAALEDTLLAACESLLKERELKDEKDRNIREGIWELKPCEGGVFARLKSGSRGNVRPADVYRHLRNALACDTDEVADIMRLEIYTGERDRLIPLWQYGVEHAG